jgi:ligand-binding sensor domain-containing protein
MGWSSRLGSGIHWAALAAVIAAAPVGAAPPTPRWVAQSWTRRDGLPQAIVRSVMASRTGHLWLGTQEGLVRFDGQQFVRLERGGHPGLASNQVTASLETPDGAIWVATGRGVSVLRDGAVRKVQALAGVRVLALARSPSGEIWVGGAPAGLFHLAGPDAQATRVEGTLGRSVASIAVLGSGRVLAGTDEGLLEIEQGEIVARTEVQPGGRVRALLVDRHGTLWAGTDLGLGRRVGGDAGFRPVEAFRDQAVNAILEATDGALWVGSAGGTRRLAGQEAEVVAAERDEVLSLAEDREGSVWAGTGSSGLRRFRPRFVDGIDSRHGLSSDAVRTVLEGRDGTLWVGTERDGLDRADARGVRPFRPDLLAGRRVRALLEDRRGVLWVSADGAGTYRFWPATGAEVAPLLADATRTYAYLEDGEGVVWVGSRSGLRAVRGDRVEVVPVDPALPSAAVTVLALAPDGTLFAGTEIGLARLAGGVLRPGPGYGGPGREGVSALRVDPDGTLWVGTTGDGLLRIRGGEFVALHTDQGLGDDGVHSIVDDGSGHLWLSGNLGLFRIARSEVEEIASGVRGRLATLRVGQQEGMKESECNGYGNPAGLRGRDGHLWFATLGGAARLDPTRPFPTLPPPVPSIEAVRVDGVPVPGNGQLVLPRGARRVEIRFAATSLTSPTSVRIRRQLVGFEATPVELGLTSGSASFGPLRPGLYQFELSASHVNGAYGGESTALTLEVPPYFWETGWFMALSVAGLIGLVAAVLEVRTRALRRSERLLEARVQAALSAAKTLRGLLPICAWCKKVRDDEGYWNQIESYVAAHSQAEFTHGMCPACSARLEATDTARAGTAP